MKSNISLRIYTNTWSDPERNREQLGYVREFHGVIDEVAFFTSITHPPLPLAELKRRAGLLGPVMDEYRQLGVRVGINHLSTIGHVDENMEHSLREPWQHLVDMSGAVSASCYCVSDPQVQRYIQECYATLAALKPEFIWLDDDVRLESHAKAIHFACFCPYCLDEFSVTSGEKWTREELLQAFKERPRTERLALRVKWMERNRRYIGRIIEQARLGVDRVSPSIQLGLMSGEIGYSGYGQADWAEALAGSENTPVRFRPGGGFYNDDQPLLLFRKAHSVGRQLAFVPPTVTDLQYEHENFPYEVWHKSRQMFVTEVAAAIAAGCTGTALNILRITADPLGEFRPYLESLLSARPFFDALVDTCGRSPCEGVWTAFGPDHLAAQGADGNWPGPPSWGDGFMVVNERYHQLGLPAAYHRKGAKVTILSGDSVLEWSKEQLTEIFSGGVLMDGPALVRLTELGLNEWAGFSVAGTRDVDISERFTDDPLNGRFSGWHRDCRPWAGSVTHLLNPLFPTARPLAVCEDFTPTVHGCCGGVYENKLGGRVAVFTYVPWTTLSSLAKSTQVRNVTRWLSRDSLPAYVSSFHRIGLWCRRDSKGRPVFILINASIDPAENIVLQARDIQGSYHALDMRNQVHAVQMDENKTDSYRTLRLPPMAPWSTLLIRAKD